MRYSPHQPQSGFATLTIIGVIVLLLVITGIGQAMWRHTLQMGEYCRNAVSAIGWYRGYDMCQSVGLYIASAKNQIENKFLQSDYGLKMSLDEFAGAMARQFAGAAIGWNSPSLQGMINPQMLQGSLGNYLNNPSQRLQLALTQGAYGNNFLQQGNLTQGLSYLRQSASLGEVGVLSQLQLGSAYGGGLGGLPRDIGAARYYNLQAAQSIQRLQMQNTPQAQRLLQALPAQPAQLVRQLKGY